MKKIILATVSFLCIGCFKKHKSTTKVCGELYVESFNVNPAGVDEDYLTDSLSFRIYIGKYDNEHENFSYVCKGDTIKVMKLVMETYGNQMKITDFVMLSLAHLKSKKKMSIDKPLFEF